MEITNTTKPNKSRRFIKDAIILVIISIVMRGISTGFMVYISNIIGAEGIGLYQLTFSVYLLFITISTSGISLAVTRIVSEQQAVGNSYASKSAFRRCMILSIILSIAASLLLYFSAHTIGVSILKDERTILSLKLLAIGLPFLSITSAIRGYFLGMKNGVKAVSTEVVEQVVQIVATVPLIALMAPMGLEFACCGLIIGATLAEIISCIYSIVLYFMDKTKIKGKQVKGLNRQIFGIAIPIAISSYVRSILTSLENILVPTGLKAYGQSSGQALSQYGMIKGMALPLLSFPSAILSAFSSLLVPEVSSENVVNTSSKTGRRIDYIINKSFKATLLFAFLIMGIFICFYNEIGMAFYKNKDVGTMLLIFAPLVPLMYLDQIVDSILKGLNQQISSMKYNTIDSALRAGIIYFLVPILGVKGYVIMLYAGTIFNAFLSINRLIVVSKVRFRMVQWVVIPCFAILVSCVFVKFTMHTNVLLSTLMVALCYFVVLALFGCVTKRDVAWVIRIFYRKKTVGTAVRG